MRGILYADRHIYPHPCLLFCQAEPLPFLPLASKVRRKVKSVEDLVWHNHVALRAPGVRSVPLLRDHNCVLHIAVHYLNP